MAAPAEQQWGVTPAFSLDPPSAADLSLNELLNAELKAQNNFAPSSDTERRDAILRKLESLLREMVEAVGRKKGLPQGLLDEAGGKVFTYGSYKLGVYGPGSDVDTLMVAPKHVTRQDFFDYMPELLRRTDKTMKLNAVPDAGTPIIKLEMQGVDIDLIFSSLQVQSVPDDIDLSDDNILRGLDEIDRRCINGTRVADSVLKLVPQSKTFRLTLRAVKLWAQRRAIYGNIAGYPGGVAYAILVARVCQLYPRAAAPQLLKKFFFVVGRWNWPKPLYLQRHEPQDPSLQLREWDPATYRSDALHLMPILTPAVPSMNTAHTIGPSSKKVIMREMARGERIVLDVYAGKKQWNDLFEKHNFFTEAYKHYLCVIAAGKTKEAAASWGSFVQAKLQWLVKGIEESDANSIELVQLFNKGFDREHHCPTHDEVQKVVEGSLDYLATETSPPLGEDGYKIWTTTYYLGIDLKKGATNLDISTPVKSFSIRCLDWPKYDDSLNSLKIKHIRNFMLPDDVFAAGEKRPVRLKKKVVKPAANGPTNKRSFANSGMEVGESRSDNRHLADAAKEQPGNVKRRPTPNGTKQAVARG
ncbi:Poly(A) polymerase papa [Piedraia hortae CBS 480.64]|uniref:Poly(A) polymerase n=1 Tax=Piedraia hortae CBS 480.64 TaxID=1314780 RepID=A0A6A7BYE8_9PEZI|nr:Poly(A) polymerase papa [Piedraia hortae CBS 480.64]